MWLILVVCVCVCVCVDIVDWYVDCVCVEGCG